MGSQRVGHNLVTKKQQLYIPPAHLDGVFTLLFHVWFLGVSSVSPREGGLHSPQSEGVPLPLTLRVPVHLQSMGRSSPLYSTLLHSDSFIHSFVQ